MQVSRWESSWLASRIKTLKDQSRAWESQTSLDERDER
jgi:hypothetical protein